MTRPVLYPLRPVDTATCGSPRAAPTPTRDDRSPAAERADAAMLLDWFTHLGGTMSYGGEIIDRYLAWHPIDHIMGTRPPAPGGGAAEGARFRIVEAFGGRPEYKVDEVDRVEKLDETGIRLVQRIGGSLIFQLEHTWSAGADGAHYVTVMDIGARSALLAPINGRVPAVSRRDGAAWVKHNIEEVGQLEYLLPQLKSSGEAEPAQRAQG